MPFSAESCRKNADDALAIADHSALPNVRARALEAAARWSDLADRHERVEKHCRSEDRRRGQASTDTFC